MKCNYDLSIYGVGFDRKADMKYVLLQHKCFAIKFKMKNVSLYRSRKLVNCQMMTARFFLIFC